MSYYKINRGVAASYRTAPCPPCLVVLVEQLFSLCPLKWHFANLWLKGSWPSPTYCLSGCFPSTAAEQHHHNQSIIDCLNKALIWYNGPNLNLLVPHYKTASNAPCGDVLYMLKNFITIKLLLPLIRTYLEMCVFPQASFLHTEHSVTIYFPTLHVQYRKTAKMSLQYL